MGLQSAETPKPGQVVAALRSAASAADGMVALRPGIDDRAMDGWGIPVPEHIRAILREVGGFDTLSPEGWTLEEFTPEHRDNYDPDGSYRSRCGAPGTFRVLHSNGAAETYYVDVDPTSGEWNGVFSLWDSINARFEAPGLGQWLLTLAHGIHRAAAATRADHFDDFDDAFGTWFWDGLPETANPSGAATAPDDRRTPPKAAVIDAPTARASFDPVLSEVGAQLPDPASVADLRGVTRRTYVPVIKHPDMGLDAAFHRFHHGQILAAVPWD